MWHPEYLDNWKFREENPIAELKDWLTVQTKWNEFIVFLSNLAKHQLYNPSQHKALVIVDAIDLILTHLPHRIKRRKLPFGNNWYNFAVDLCTFFNVARLAKVTRTDQDAAIYSYINQFIPGPPINDWISSRTGSNVVYLYFNWWLNEKIHLGIVPNIDTRHVELKFHPILRNEFSDDEHSNTGHYTDYSCIEHGNLPTVAYILSLARSYLSLYKTVFNDSRQCSVFKITLDKLLHPTIHIVPVFYFQRKSQLVSQYPLVAFGSKGRLGLDIMRVTGTFAFKTPETLFSIRVQNKMLAGFESDVNNGIKWPLWITARKIYTNNFKYKDVLNEQEIMDIPGVFSSTHIHDTKTLTAKTHSPEYAQSFIHHSTDASKVYWYQHYRFSFMPLNIRELGAYDGTTMTVTYNVANHAEEDWKMAYEDKENPMVKNLIIGKVDYKNGYVNIPARKKIRFSLIQYIGDVPSRLVIDMKDEIISIEEKQVIEIDANTFLLDDVILSNTPKDLLEYKGSRYRSISDNSAAFEKIKSDSNK